MTRKTVIESRKSERGNALLWRVTTLWSKQNRLTSAKQNTVSDLISKLWINIMLKGFFWSLSMLYWTLTTAEKPEILRQTVKLQIKINKDQTKLLFPWQLWARTYAYACAVCVNQPLSVQCFILVIPGFSIPAFQLLATPPECGRFRILVFQCRSATSNYLV